MDLLEEFLLDLIGRKSYDENIKTTWTSDGVIESVRRVFETCNGFIVSYCFKILFFVLFIGWQKYFSCCFLLNASIRKCTSL